MWLWHDILPGRCGSIKVLPLTKMHPPFASLSTLRREKRALGGCGLCCESYLYSVSHAASSYQERQHQATRNDNINGERRPSTSTRVGSEKSKTFFSPLTTVLADMLARSCVLIFVCWSWSLASGFKPRNWGRIWLWVRSLHWAMNVRGIAKSVRAVLVGKWVWWWNLCLIWLCSSFADRQKENRQKKKESTRLIREMFSYQDFYACTLSTIIGYRIVHDPNRGALTPFHSVQNGAMLNIISVPSFMYHSHHAHCSFHIPHVSCCSTNIDHKQFWKRLLALPEWGSMQQQSVYLSCL